MLNTIGIDHRAVAIRPSPGIESKPEKNVEWIRQGNNVTEGQEDRPSEIPRQML